MYSPLSKDAERAIQWIFSESVNDYTVEELRHQIIEHFGAEVYRELETFFKIRSMTKKGNDDEV